MFAHGVGEEPRDFPVENRSRGAVVFALVQQLMPSRLYHGHNQIMVINMTHERVSYSDVFGRVDVEALSVVDQRRDLLSSQIDFAFQLLEMQISVRRTFGLQID